MQTSIHALYEWVFHRPPPSHTAVLIANWITAKEKYEEEMTSILFIIYQDATTTLLNDEDAKHIMTQLLMARRSYAGE